MFSFSQFFNSEIDRGLHLQAFGGQEVGFAHRGALPQLRLRGLTSRAIWGWVCGWYLIWLVVWKINFIFPLILGMSSSQLTNSYFSEGWPNHQPVMIFGSRSEKLEPQPGSIFMISEPVFTRTWLVIFQDFWVRKPGLEPRFKDQKGRARKTGAMVSLDLINLEFHSINIYKLLVSKARVGRWSTLTLAEVGVDPKLMGIGPAFAIPPALEKAPSRVGLTNQLVAINHPIVGTLYPMINPSWGWFIIGFTTLWVIQFQGMSWIFTNPHFQQSATSEEFVACTILDFSWLSYHFSRLGWRWRTSTSMRSMRPLPRRPPCAWAMTTSYDSEPAAPHLWWSWDLAANPQRQRSTDLAWKLVVWFSTTALVCSKRIKRTCISAFSIRISHVQKMTCHHTKLGKPEVCGSSQDSHGEGRNSTPGDLGLEDGRTWGICVSLENHKNLWCFHVWWFFDCVELGPWKDKRQSLFCSVIGWAMLWGMGCRIFRWPHLVRGHPSVKIPSAHWWPRILTQT